MNRTGTWYGDRGRVRAEERRTRRPVARTTLPQQDDSDSGEDDQGPVAWITLPHRDESDSDESSYYASESDEDVERRFESSSESEEDDWFGSLLEHALEECQVDIGQLSEQVQWDLCQDIERRLRGLEQNRTVREPVEQALQPSKLGTESAESLVRGQAARRESVEIPKPDASKPKTESGDAHQLEHDAIESGVANDVAQDTVTNGNTTEFSPVHLSSVTFKVVRHVEFGQTVAVVGGTESLGNWKPEVAIPLTWTEDDVWTVDIKLPSGPYEYKFLVFDADGTLLEWYPGENLFADVPADGVSLENQWGLPVIAEPEVEGGPEEETPTLEALVEEVDAAEPFPEIDTTLATSEIQEVTEFQKGADAAKDVGVDSDQQDQCWTKGDKGQRRSEVSGRSSWKDPVGRYSAKCGVKETVVRTTLSKEPTRPVLVERRATVSERTGFERRTWDPGIPNSE